jgi:hypothetical protein
MERVKIDKMECRFPILFKAMWVITIEWLIISIANYYGQWLLQNRLDGVGICILLLFAATIVLCFRKGFLNMVSQHGYVRSFILFTGRIRRLGIEIALALTAMVCFLISTKESFGLNVVVVVIACAFLYDIWHFADFKETKISMSQIKWLINEDD